MHYSKRRIFLHFLILGSGLNCANGQTIGSNQTQIQNFKHHSVTQAIGQPYAIVSTTVQKKYHLNQGQILPNVTRRNTINNLTLRIYPNPVIDVLQVHLESNTQISNIDIYDINGRIMAKQVFPSNKNSESINLESWSAGIYIIQVKDTNGKSTSLKFTKATTAKK